MCDPDILAEELGIDGADLWMRAGAERPCEDDIIGLPRSGIRKRRRRKRKERRKRRRKRRKERRKRGKGLGAVLKKAGKTLFDPGGFVMKGEGLVDVPDFKEAMGMFGMGGQPGAPGAIPGGGGMPGMGGGGSGSIISQPAGPSVAHGSPPVIVKF